MKKLILISIVVIIAFVTHRFYTMPTTIIPYPYIIKKTMWPDQKNIQNNQVLIVGDRMAQRLNKYIPIIQTKSSKNLKEPLRIINWSAPHEGLHRTIARLKSLTKLPPVIIYHGASEEVYEKKFWLNNRKIILENIETYQDESKISLILTFPILSKILYQKVHYYSLRTTPTKMSKNYNSIKQQILMELTYKIFELELDELIEYVRSKGSKLILFTTPINLDTPPRKVCDNSSSTTLEEKLTAIRSIVEQGDNKSALSQLHKLQKISIANAEVLYLYGQTAKKLGRVKDARKILHKAAIFDCENWRSNKIFNSIIRSRAQRANLLLVDFDKEINKHYGQNVLFFDEIYPQEIFYQHIAQILARSISKVLHI